MWASQIALIQHVHGQGYILIFLDRMPLLFTQVHFLFWQPCRVGGQYIPVWLASSHHFLSLSMIQNRVRNFPVYTTRHVKTSNIYSLISDLIFQYILFNTWVRNVIPSTNTVIWSLTNTPKFLDPRGSLTKLWPITCTSTFTTPFWGEPQKSLAKNVDLIKGDLTEHKMSFTSFRNFQTPL